MAQLNPYGDALVSTTGRHGGDIAAQRLDELDRACLRDAFELAPESVAVDLGCGFALQGMRLSCLGIETHLYDLMDLAQQVARFNQAVPGHHLNFHQVDLSRAAAVEFPGRVDIAYSQRFIHYLTYDNALALLKGLAHKMLKGARAFISASGLQSELGQGYTHGGKPVLLRYCNLSEQVANKHNIHSPVCLYSREDLSRLLSESGFSAERLWLSDFGNVKGVFTKQ